MTTIQLPHDHGHDEHHIVDNMPDAEKFADAALLYSMLDDPSRLKIFWLLCHTEECVSNIAAMVGMSTSSVSHHLKILQANHLVVSRRIGKEIHYTLAPSEQAAFTHNMIESYFHMDCPLHNHS